MEEKAIHQAVAGMFAPIAGSFVIDSLQMMIPWLIAMFCVIICDLVTGVRKSISNGYFSVNGKMAGTMEEIRDKVEGLFAAE